MVNQQEQVMGGGGIDAVPLPLRQEATLGEEYKDSFQLTNFIVLVGMKGATKTCNLVRFGLKSLIQWKRPVYSDFPFMADICGQHFEPEPMPDELFVTYGKGIPRNAVILTDELQEFFDRQNWMSVESKLGVSEFQQIRKLGFLIIGATQYLSYINARVNEQMDILIRCKDLRMTPWGINEGIRRGREALLQYFDCCGAFDVRGSARNIGNPHFITGPPFAEELVFTEPLWRFFDSRRLTAIEHKFRRFVLQKEKVPVPMLGNNHGTSDIESKEAISDLLSSLRGEQVKEVQSTVFNRMLAESGTNINLNTQRGIIREFGIEVKYKKDGTYYQL